MIKEFWKVTISKHSWGGFVKEPFTLHYKVGGKTIPNFGKIFVFDSAVSLHDFAPDGEDFSKRFFVFRGYAENPHRIKNIAYSTPAIFTFWEFKKQKKRLTGLGVPFATTVPPKGTFVCDSFTPKKMYTWHEFNEYMRGLK